MLLVLYDVLRIIRNVFPHEGMLMTVEDLSYWIFNAWFLFRMMYRENNGELRGYVMVGVVLGMVLYNVTISPHIVRSISWIFLHIRKKCEILKNRLKKPLKHITIILHNYFTKKVGKDHGKKSSKKA